MKFKIYYLILLIITFVLSCKNNKVDKDKNVSINKEQVVSLLDRFLDPYVDFQWVSVKIEEYSFTSYPTHSIVALGKSEIYGNEVLEAHANIYTENGDPYTNVVIVQHKNIGDIIHISSNDTLLNFIMDSLSFSEKISAYNEKLRLAEVERLNLVELANKNMTKVHFGITELQYKDFGKELQKNFIEGIIRKDLFEYSDPIFSNNKFVGFEVNYDSSERFDKLRMLDYAKSGDYKCTNESHRYSIMYSNLFNNLYNLQISEIIPKGSGMINITIKVYWNSYMNIYK